MVLKDDVKTSISTPPTLLAWCSQYNNKISVIDLDTKQSYATFDGASIGDTKWSATYVQEISGTKFLVSLHHHGLASANMSVFDISKIGKANKIYSLGKVSGVTGFGDVTYNSRRKILGAIPVKHRIAYHLFTINTPFKTNDIVKLMRKSKWHLQNTTKTNNWIAGFDFNPAGESIATIDCYGVCLIADVNTNNYGFHLNLRSEDCYSRCRWSTNSDEALLFVKYNADLLNILDVEKKVLTLKNPVKLESGTMYNPHTYWIDVCQSNGNLLAAAEHNMSIKIFDKRESKIVMKFEGYHSNAVFCVRWNQSGDTLASASADNSVKLLDFKTGKTLYTGATFDGNYARSICFV